MGTTTTLETRVRIMELAQVGYSDQQIADKVGYAIATVRKWRQRSQKYGRAGIERPMGRPARGALSSFSAELREEIDLLRRQHPGWGPDTLVVELARDPHWQGHRRPSRASIGRYLREQGLSRSYGRPTQLPQTPPQRASAPHAVWEVDARGDEYLPNVGMVALINVQDCCSRARIISFPALLGQQRRRHQPNTEHYQLALRLAFSDWGMPQQVQVDHASVFFDNTTKSPFPTRMHLWLTALGIDVHFSRPHRPTDQASVERSHQLWAAQVLAGQSFAAWDTLFWALQNRRDFLNTALPCASLAGLPPLLAFPQATHSGRHYRPEWEAELLDLERVYTYLRQGRWFRPVNQNGCISIGGRPLSVGKHLAGKQLEITLHPDHPRLICRNGQGEVVAERRLQHLTKEYLMGHFSTAFNLPYFQLALPFPGEAQQVIRLFETMSVTTL